MNEEEAEKKMQTHLPLAGEVSVPGRDAHDERVEGGKRIGVDDGEIGFCGRVHYGEDLLRERLGNPKGLSDSLAPLSAQFKLQNALVNLSCTTGLLDAGLD